MAGQEVFVTNMESPDGATRKLSGVGIQESFLRRFWVSCNGVFTTETQRGEAATKVKNNI